MLVNGGWRGWVRLASGMGCVACVGLIAGLGCGSRTSVLDLEAYAAGGSSSGGFNVGGRSSGAGGKVSGSAGAPNAMSTATQCAQYCSGYATTCAQKLKGQNCQQVCASEIDGFGATCQALGLTAITCLAPFFKAGNGSCDVATNKGLLQCGTTLASFKTCEVGNKQTPTPTPTPVPNPPPASSDPLACPTMGDYDGNSCKYLFNCPEGAYTTTCQRAADGVASRCLCSHGDQSFTSDMPVDLSVACYVAVSLCTQ